MEVGVGILTKTECNRYFTTKHFITLRQVMVLLHTSLKFIPTTSVLMIALN